MGLAGYLQCTSVQDSIPRLAEQAGEQPGLQKNSCTEICGCLYLYQSRHGRTPSTQLGLPE